MSLDNRSAVQKAAGLMQIPIVMAMTQKDAFTRSPVDIADEIASPSVRAVFKTAVDAGRTDDGDYAGTLSYRSLSDDFVSSLRGISAFDAIRPFSVQLPPDVSIAVSSTTSIGTVVGQGIQKPVRAQAWGIAAPAMQRVVWLGFVNDEVLRSPLADRALAAEARVGVAVGGDVALLAHLQSGAATVPSSGTTEAAAVADFGDALAVLPLGAGSRPVAILAAPQMARLALLLSGRFPDLRVDGGEAAGILFVATDAVEVETSGSSITIVDASAMVTADAGVTVRTSREATLQMDDQPTSPATNETVFRSLFQQNQTAILAERLIAFAKARSSAAVVITGCNTGANRGRDPAFDSEQAQIARADRQGSRSFADVRKAGRSLTDDRADGSTHRRAADAIALCRD